MLVEEEKEEEEDGHRVQLYCCLSESEKEEKSERGDSSGLELGDLTI